MAGKIVVGLDVGSYAIKAVALQANKGRLTLQGFAQMRIGDGEVAVAVRRVVEQLGIRPKNLVTSVSGRSVIVRQVETPRLDQAQLRSHIAYEADKYIPFGADEVVIDCQTLDPATTEEANPNMKVLLVAVRRGFVEDHLRTLQDAGVTPSVVDVDVFALCNAWWTLGPMVGDNEQAETTALIDVGASKTWVAIVKGTELLFQREIYLAGNEITDAIVRTFGEQAEDVEQIKLAPGEALDALIDAAMPALEDLANEIRLSFDYVEGQFDQEVQQVILSGGTSQLPGMSEVLGNILGRPVQVFDPLAGLDLIPSRYDLHTLEENAPGLTVALGQACHVAGVGISGLSGAQSGMWTARGSRPGAIPGGAAMGAPDGPPDDLMGGETVDTMAGMGMDTAATVQAPLDFQPPAAPPPLPIDDGMTPGDVPALPSFPTPAPGSLEAPPEPATLAVAPPPVIAPPPAPEPATLDVNMAGMSEPPPPAAEIPQTDLPVEDEYTGRSSVLVVLDDDGAGDDADDEVPPGALDSDDDIDNLPPLPT